MNEVVTINAETLAALQGKLDAQQQMLMEKDRLIELKQRTLQEQQDELERQLQTLAERDEHIAWLEEFLKLLQSKKYRHSSEKLNALQGQLFDESEVDAQIKEAQAKIAQDRAGRAAGKGGSSGTDSRATQAPEKRPARKPLPNHFRRIQVDIDVSAEDKQAMGDDWVQIGWDCSEQLACQEREYYVKQIRRAKYVRKPQDPDDKGQGIKVAPVYPVILPRALCDASVLAKILTGKFVDALSFNRECKVLQREGVELSYSTVCSYPIQLNERLAPLKALFYDYAAAQTLWHLDETTLQVLQEPGRQARSKSYLWALRTGPPHAPIVMFHYAERRNYEALSNWLSEPLATFNGVIVTDEHKPYQQLTDNTPGIKARGGCWAHARRKYADAVKGRRHDSEAHQLLKQISKLYRLEQKTAHLTGSEKLERRQVLIQPWLDGFKAQVDELLPRYMTKGLLRTALFYTQNNWQSLTAFMHHADIPLDNNLIENAIRPFTVGRRNWLYSASPRGAHASAFIYSLVESAKANGLEPRAYLQTLFERYPHAKTTEQRRQLLPMFLKNSGYDR